MDKMLVIMIALQLAGIFIYLSLSLYNAYGQTLWLSFIKAFSISPSCIYLQF